MKKKLTITLLTILVSLLVLPTSIFADSKDDSDSLHLDNSTTFTLTIDHSDFSLGSIRENLSNLISFFKGEELSFDRGDIKLGFEKDTESNIKVNSSSVGSGFIFSDTLKTNSFINETIGNIKSLLPTFSVSNLGSNFVNNIDLDVAALQDIGKHYKGITVKKVCLEGETGGYVSIDLSDLGINLVDGITGIEVDGNTYNNYNIDENDHPTINVDRKAKEVSVQTKQGKIIIAIQ